MGRKGLTLTELLIVLVVLEILAGIAMPGYRKTIERQLWQEAQNVLVTIYSGERAYWFANNSTYLPIPAGSPLATWRQIFMDRPDTAQITYQVIQANWNPNIFIATATRNDGSGRNMFIDGDRNLNLNTWPQP
jgi:prepilin-type N-terminal cleavage/methylation domain-containing protein